LNLIKYFVYFISSNVYDSSSTTVTFRLAPSGFTFFSTETTTPFSSADFNTPVSFEPLFQQHLHLVSDVLDVLAKYLERRSNAGGANLQLIILDVTIQMLLQIPAQLGAIINAYRFIVINFNELSGFPV